MPSFGANDGLLDLTSGKLPRCWRDSVPVRLFVLRARRIAAASRNLGHPGVSGVMRWNMLFPCWSTTEVQQSSNIRSRNPDADSKETWQEEYVKPVGDVIVELLEATERVVPFLVCRCLPEIQIAGGL